MGLFGAALLATTNCLGLFGAEMFWRLLAFAWLLSLLLQTLSLSAKFVISEDCEHYVTNKVKVKTLNW